jgi:hypothetical protein
LTLRDRVIAMALWHDVKMVKRSSRMAKRDDYQNVLKTIEAALGSSLKKNPAAVALRRDGGLEHTKAKAKEFTPKQRTAIASAEKLAKDEDESV